MKPPPVGRELEACCVSAAKVSFLAGGSWLHLGGGPPPRSVLLFFSSALTRATSSCAVWPCSWSCSRFCTRQPPFGRGLERESCGDIFRPMFQVSCHFGFSWRFPESLDKVFDQLSFLLL